MKPAIKILFILVFFLGMGVLSFADRGKLVKKEKSQVNIEIHNTLKNSVRFNLSSGLSYDGSEIVDMKKVGNSLVAETVVSYKKGNTTYLIPYKQKIAIPEYSQKDGYKLVLRNNK